MRQRLSECLRLLHGGLFLKSFSSLQPVGLLLLRAALAVIFIHHGYPQLIHTASARGFYLQHGMPAYFAYVCGVLEVFGGGLLILGLFTQVAALLLAIEMSVLIWKAYSSGGYLAVHEYEFPLSLAAACFALATVGAGLVSIDYLLLGGGSKSAAPRAARKK